MKNEQTSRRRFLVAAITCSTVAASLPGTAWLKSSMAWADTSEDQSGLLARMARHLFPHDRIGDDVYAAIMDGVLGATAADPAMTGALQAIEAAMDSARDKSFLQLAEDQQIAVLRELQNAAYFSPVLETLRGHFYYNPVVWQHIDYPGSSREHGGYINRGFDDIDWLPKAS